MIEITEIFRGIQGEGTRAGMICTFVRLAGCNLRCGYCDTAYAWAPGEARSVADVGDEVARLGARLVTVTGGEPLLQDDCAALCAMLVKRGYTTLVETNGSIDIDRAPPGCIRIMDIKCPGSNEQQSLRPENIEKLTEHDECKFVVSNREDFDWALRCIERHELSRRCTVLVSPNLRTAPPADVAAWILESNAPVRLSLQLHTLIWGPDVRGV